MPQKRNPDVAELTRGKSGRLVGNLTAVLTLLKGLPTGYNRDLQEDKALLFDSMDTLFLTLPAVAGTIRTLRFRQDRIARALDAQLLATDLADHLVRRGVPFRESHEIVGGLVKQAEARECSILELPLEVLQDAHPSLDDGIRSQLGWEASVDARRVPGGTGRDALTSQLEAVRKRLDEFRPDGPPA